MTDSGSTAYTMLVGLGEEEVVSLCSRSHNRMSCGVVVGSGHIHSPAHLAQTEHTSILQRIFPQTFEQSTHFLFESSVSFPSL
jgi:hypothetical protein